MKILLLPTRTYFRLALLGLLVAATPAAAQSPAVASAAGAAAKPTGALTRQLDDYVKLYEQAGLFSGSVLVADQGRVVLQKGYGLADRAAGTPNTPDTKFRIGSLTKQFTAALVLRLVEQGQLKLDGRVGDYLPDYPSAAGRALTLHQLLTHTAGLPEYTTQPAFAPVANTPQTPAQLVALFAKLPLDFAPGSRFRYSNSNYILLGAIIEKVTGKSYAQVFEALLARPAGLRATAYAPTEPADPRRAAGYQPTPNGLVPAPPINMSTPYAAGAITSTVTDLYRWHEVLLGTKVLSAASQRLLFTPVQENYAYGWTVFKARLGARYGYGAGAQRGRQWICLLPGAGAAAPAVHRAARQPQQHPRPCRPAAGPAPPHQPSAGHPAQHCHCAYCRASHTRRSHRRARRRAKHLCGYL
jgi:CubicO group peptidase (beta-lactamase class C family)